MSDLPSTQNIQSPPSGFSKYSGWVAGVSIILGFLGFAFLLYGIGSAYWFLGLLWSLTAIFGIVFGIICAIYTLGNNSIKVKSEQNNQKKSSSVANVFMVVIIIFAIYLVFCIVMAMSGL